MKISYNWLKDYLKFDLSPEKVAEILTNTGLEVEGIEEFQSVKGGLKGVVIGEVTDCKKHPNADKLSVTKVNIGTDEDLQIVCGAPNVSSGQKVPVALVGTTLYKGDESLTLKKTKIRGELSEGMICAEDELGLGENHDGIMVLNPEAIPGSPASEYFNIENDTVFEIGLTPNRIDAACHIGVARDLAAYLSLSSKVQIKKPSVDGLTISNNNNMIDVKIENPESCPRYSGISISNITVKTSPGWLQNKLKAIGLNPINNIVDISNFVLHETGQPLHTFDADKLRKKQIIVKNLPGGTKFTTLDEIERELSQDDLVICDGEGPVALGGVFGGINSGITEETKNVFIESAHFNPVTTRKTAKRHMLSTDSSFRFERGVDPVGTIYAMKRAALLILELAGGEISSDIVDVYPNKIEDKIVKLTYAHTDRLIGKKIDRDIIKNILISLDFIINDETNDALELIVPGYRYEVTREADVIEEILRIYGYNNVETAEQVNSTISHTIKPDPEKLINTITDYLTNIGFAEIIINSLTKSAYYEELGIFNQDNMVKIINPLSSDLSVMRQTLLFGGLETIIYNQNRKINNLKLFEFGYTYIMDFESGNKNDQKNYKETKHLALLITGQRADSNWNTKGENFTFFDIKTFTDNIISRLGINAENLKQEHITNEIYTDALKYSYNSKSICIYGLVNKQVLKYFDIESEVYYADINWDNLVSLVSKKNITFQPIPKFPEVKRDLALLLDKNIAYSKIKELAYRTERKLLKRLNLFDVYEGKNIEEGKKSYAVSFTLQDDNNTLTDKQIDKIMNKFIHVFEKDLGAGIR